MGPPWKFIVFIEKTYPRNGFHKNQWIFIEFPWISSNFLEFPCIAMNFQDISEYMKTYLSVFEQSSFILKPSNLWNTNTFAPAPKPLTACSPGEVSYVYQDTSGGSDGTCYEFCLSNSQIPKAGASVTATIQNKGGGSTSSVQLQKLDTTTNSCIQAGYTAVPGGFLNASATVTDTTTGKTNTVYGTGYIQKTATNGWYKTG